MNATSSDMPRSEVIRRVAAYSKAYQRDVLARWNPEELLANWWSALDFFFGHAFFQGRLDIVSERVYEEAMSVLVTFFESSGDHPACEHLKNADRTDLRMKLQEKIGKGKVGKGRDITMVLSTLDFVSRLENGNIVDLTVRRIKDGDVDKHFRELQGSLSKNRIFQVGTKVATFYIRDTVSLFDMEGAIPADKAECLQPIDVWVRKLFRALGLASEDASDEQIQAEIVRACSEANESSLRFNQGAWYLGYNAFDIVVRDVLRR